MEKRALLAVILSMTVLLIWGYFEQKNAQERRSIQEKIEAEAIRSEPQEAPPLKEQVWVKADDKPVDIKSLTTIPSYLDGDPGLVRDVVVENDTAVITLTNLGARLKGYRLKKYRDKDGNSFEMLPELDYEQMPLELDIRQGGGLLTTGGALLDSELFSSRVNRAVYKVDKDRLELSDKYPSGKVSMSYHDASGVTVIKEFTFYDNKYGFDLNVRLEGLARYPEGVPYSVMWGGSISEDKRRKGRQFGVQVITFDGNETRKRKWKKLSGDQVVTEPIQWVAMGTKYFVAGMISRQSSAPAILSREDQGKVGMGMKLHTSAPGADEPQLTLYVGPKEAKRLQTYGSSFQKTIDFGWTLFGETITRGLATPLMAILIWFYSFTNNYGLAIILLTIVIKIVFYPLTRKSFVAMQRMQVLQPKMKVLQERYKNDRQRLNQEMMQLYKTHKANPMGGCLPMLAQLPIFYALYIVLMYSIELRQAPFIWWIKDLSDYDPYFVTPIVMGLTMFLQQKMTPTMGDPRQAKMMLMMPVIFTVMFIYFPVGLVIYWLVSNLVTIAQQYYIKRRMPTAPAKK